MIFLYFYDHGHVHGYNCYVRGFDGGHEYGYHGGHDYGHRGHYGYHGHDYVHDYNCSSCVYDRVYDYSYVRVYYHCFVNEN